MVALHAAIHNSGVSLLPNTLFCRLQINPIRITPHIRVYFAEFDSSAGVIYNCLLKCLIEISIVKENIWIVKPSVEMPFHRFYGLDNTLQLLVSRQDYQRCVCPWSTCFGLETSGYEHFVVVFTYFAMVKLVFAPDSAKIVVELAVWMGALRQASSILQVTTDVG